jgi:hypothetical protein
MPGWYLTTRIRQEVRQSCYSRGWAGHPYRVVRRYGRPWVRMLYRDSNFGVQVAARGVPRLATRQKAGTMASAVVRCFDPRWQKSTVDINGFRHLRLRRNISSPPPASGSAFKHGSARLRDFNGERDIPRQAPVRIRRCSGVPAVRTPASGRAPPGLSDARPKPALRNRSPWLRCGTPAASLMRCVSLVMVFCR